MVKHFDAVVAVAAVVASAQTLVSSNAPFVVMVLRRALWQCSGECSGSGMGVVWQRYGSALAVLWRVVWEGYGRGMAPGRPVDVARLTVAPPLDRAVFEFVVDDPRSPGQARCLSWNDAGITKVTTR